ncbi:MAG: hypothetical protein EOO85_29005 [Pedobacter sp.]|jgi:hypothetical protein|nr:MAG: hypothetical protein EOO85_29005 [Pedobacter sp.]
MKIMAILLNLYMAMLMLMPCQDSLDTSAPTEISISTHKDSDASKDCDQELCPPFCSCACCSIGKNLPIANVLQVSSKEPSDIYADQITSPLSKQQFAIWQPPKLAS